MNDVISKLYDESLIIESNGDYVRGELDIEKFAELIVRECLTQVRNMCDKCRVAGDKEQALGVAWAGLSIAKYFGVK